MFSHLCKTAHSAILCRFVIGLFVMLMHDAAFAIIPLEATKNPGPVILSASDDIQKFLLKYVKLPAEPFSDSSAEKTFLYRLQKEIPSLLATEGYFSPKITLSHRALDDSVQHEIQVDAGPLMRVGNVSITFQGDITQDREAYRKRIEHIRESWSLKRDAPFRSGDWEQAKSTLLATVAEEDFAAAQIVSSQASIDPEHARANLAIVIDSGPVFYLGDIHIEGLERYDQSMILDLAPFKAGDAYRRDALQLFQITLQKAPQFGTVSVTISTDIAQHAATPVQVAVTEIQSQRFAFGAGYSSNNGGRGEINYRNHNFLDRAWNLTSMLRLEQRRQTFFAGIDTLPDRNNVFYSLGANLQMTDIENLKTIEQKIGLSRNFQTAETQMQFGLNWQREDKRPDGAIHQINKALTLDWRWRRQIIDNPLHIRRGDATEIRIGGGTQFLLSDQDFIRAYARHQSWWPVGSQDVIFFRAEVGYTLASSRFGIPQEYLFRAGGIQSIRGYDFKSIGVQEGSAIVGGRIMATGTVEYTHWLTQQWGAAAFADIGSAADSWHRMHPFLGYGGGIRWRSPAGPIALDLARSHETGTLRFHFSMAIVF
ncbi:MAG: BamA/TamA family outer membrane protein [Nitrosomonas sp.]|nr:BamA/TamA family outer membrane protein [Nitrosomonas sp.]